MTEQERLLNVLTKTIDDSISSFNQSIPAIQKTILNRIVLLIKDLDISPAGQIKNSVKNLKVIGQLKSEIEKIVLNPKYLKQVKKFAEAFSTVADIQHQYFNSLSDDFTPSRLLAEIQKQAIGYTINSLTESGLNYNVTESIKDILRRNITEGGSYSDLANQLRNSIVSNKEGNGLLERYVNKTVIDSINQFNAQYAHAISDDLGFKWYWYIGTLIETSRCFCVALIKKKYIHESEFQKIVEGDFDEFKDKECAIYPKTGLPQGMIEGTDASNFKIRRGGHRCAHQLAPVPASLVPADIRAKISATA